MKLNTGLEKYITEHMEDEDPVLRELSRETYLKTINPRMISGHWQGQLLTMITKMIRPVNALEIGTFTGYSAICIARGLAKNGVLNTIECNDELQEMASRYYQLAGVSNKIVSYSGNALDIIPRLNKKFGLVYIDGEKKEYLQYYELLVNKVISGGFILADNVLWNGKVASDKPVADAQLKGILEFNRYVKNDMRVENIILPVRDGLSIIRKL